MTHSITLLSSFYFFNAFEHCQALTFLYYLVTVCPTPPPSPASLTRTLNRGIIHFVHWHLELCLGHVGTQIFVE